MTAELPEGPCKQDLLTEPEGLRQGVDLSRDAPGYLGPRPPAGDAGPHAYHVQIFALDRVLSVLVGRVLAARRPSPRARLSTSRPVARPSSPAASSSARSRARKARFRALRLQMRRQGRWAEDARQNAPDPRVNRMPCRFGWLALVGRVELTSPWIKSPNSKTAFATC